MSKPKDTRKSTKVKKGNTHFTVYPYRDGWRFAWRARESDPWKYITRAKKADAIAAAENKLDEIETGGLIWSALPAARRRFLEAWTRQQAFPPETPGICANRKQKTKTTSGATVPKI